MERDPLPMYHHRLLSLGVDEAALVAIQQHVAEDVARAAVEAKAAPPPPIESAFRDVWAGGGSAWRS
jgi:pyruvate dehydrogenase E1 component alpha subunit